MDVSDASNLIYIKKKKEWKVAKWGRRKKKYFKAAAILGLGGS